MRHAEPGEQQPPWIRHLSLAVLGLLALTPPVLAAEPLSPEPGLLVAVSAPGEGARPRAGERVVCIFFAEQHGADGSITECFPAFLPARDGERPAGGYRRGGYRVIGPGSVAAGPATGQAVAILKSSTKSGVQGRTATPAAATTPTQVAIEAGVDVVPEGIGSVSLSVTRFCPEAICDVPAAMVQLSTVAGSAESGSDFEPQPDPGTIIWAAGELSTQTASINIVDDPVHEPDVESFSVTFIDWSGTEPAEGLDRVFIEIVDDDPQVDPSSAPTELSLELEVDVVPEDVGRVRVSVRRECTGQPCSIAPASVEYATEESGSARADRDFESVSGSLSWGAGDLGIRSFVFRIADDNRHEPDIESFRVVLRNPTGAGIRPGAGEAFIEIVDDDPAEGSLRFAAADFLVGETGGAATVRVLRETGSEGRASVTVSAAPGSARGEDFGPVSPSTLIWADGEAGEKTVSVEVSEDDDSDNETVILTLGEPVGARLGSPATATLTIIDGQREAGRITFARQTRSVNESTGAVEIFVRRVGGSSGEMSVDVNVEGSGDDPAEETVDFTGPTPRRLTWPDGSSESQLLKGLRIVDDNLKEEKESVILRLVPVGSTRLGTISDLTLTIRDNDRPGRLAAIGGTEVSGLVGETLDLGVEVIGTAGKPVQGVEVVWRIQADSADSELFAGSCDDRSSNDGSPLPTATNADGLAVVCLEPTTPGKVEIEASSEGLVEVFSITADLDFDPDDPGGLDEDELPVALALGREGRVCSSDEISPELREVCDLVAELRGNRDEAGGEDSLKRALDALGIDDHASQADSARNAGASQRANLLARMASIKSGAAGIGIEQLALDMRGERLSGQVLASLLRPTERRRIQALSGDRILPHPGPWELSQPGLGELSSARDLARLLAPHGDHGADPFDLESLLAAEDPPEAKTTGAEADEHFTRRLRLFVNGTIAFGERPSQDTDTGYDFETAGLSFGADYRLSDSLFVGGALGHVSTDVELENSSRVETDGLSLGLFALYLPTAHLAVDGLAIYGRNRLEMDRFVDFPGRPARVRGSPDGDQVSLGLGVGYDGSLGRWYLSGFGRLSYLEARVDAYEERGAVETTGYELRIGEQELTSLVSRIGLDLSYAASDRTPALLPGLSVSYLHEFEDDSRVLTASFVGDLRASPATFAIPTEQPDRDYFSAALSLQALFACDRQLWFAFEQDLERSDLDLYMLRAGFKFALGGCKKAVLPPSGRPGSGGSKTTGE